MTSDFNSLNDNHQSSSDSYSAPSSGSLNTIQRDRFELLSAYMDGEVTAAERRQVEDWLANDPTVQRLHARLLKLRQGFQSMPVPTSEASVQETVDHVFAEVERRPKLRLVWGGAAIAALFVSAFVGVLSGNQGPMPQVAQSPQQETQSPEPTAPSSEALLVALDKPLVPLPNAAGTDSSLPDTSGAPETQKDTLH